MNLNEITVTDIVQFLKGLDRKTWIKVGVVTLVIIVVGYFVVWPAWYSRFGVRDQIKVLEQQMVTLNALEQREPELLQSKENTLKFIQGAKDRLFTRGEVSLMLGQISKLSKESNVTIISSSPKPSQVEFPAPFNAQYEASYGDFTVEGTYHEIGDFIAKIESFDKLLRVQLFEIVPGQEENPEKHTASMSLSAVSFKQKA